MIIIMNFLSFFISTFLDTEVIITEIVFTIYNLQFSVVRNWTCEWPQFALHHFATLVAAIHLACALLQPRADGAPAFKC